MFKLTPSIRPPTQTPNKTTVCVHKIKTTKPIPTSTSNKYAIFAKDDTNENDDDDILNEEYTTEVELGSSDNNNKNIPEIFDDEASQLTVATKNLVEDHHASNVPQGLPPKNYENDDDDIMNEEFTTEVELGSSDNTNKNITEIFDDEASQLTVATKNSTKDHYASNVPHGLSPNVPHGFPANQRATDFDLFPVSSEGSQHDVQSPKHPTKPKKSHKNRNKKQTKTKRNRPVSREWENKQRMIMRTREAVPVVKPKAHRRIPQ